MRLRQGRDNPTFVFIVLVLVSFVLMTFDAQRTEQTGFVGILRNGAAALFGPVQRGVDFVADPVFEFVSGVASIATLRQQNEILVRENEEFRARIQEVSRLELENEQLRALLDLESQLELETIPIVADVTGATEDGGLLIAKGTGDGVVIGMPVLNESQLLIGRIVQATEQQAVAELLNQLASSPVLEDLLIDATDAVVVDTPDGVTGVVTGTGRVGELRLSVEFGALYVPEGTVFTTAGFGLPRGLQVGFAEEELVPLGDTIIDARITPFADFSRLPRFVLILPILERPGGDIATDDTVVEDSDEDVPTEGDTNG